MKISSLIIQPIHRFRKKLLPRLLTIKFVKVETKKSWLYQNIPSPFFVTPKSYYSDKIEQLAQDTENIGKKPLWSGYSTIKNYPRSIGENAKRSSNQVRTVDSLGNFYAWLTAKRKPLTIVEFGTAFGVSGMYWLAGIEEAKCGQLLTFEPNQIWAQIAHQNLSAISQKYELTMGTFEEHINEKLAKNQYIDIAFIDAIHTSEFVWHQYQIVAERLSSQGIIIFDDIFFSQDMNSCWKEIALDKRITTSAEIGHRVGIVEFA